jgi:hypothetical protein
LERLLKFAPLSIRRALTSVVVEAICLSSLSE